MSRAPRITCPKKTLVIEYGMFSLHCLRPMSRCSATFVAGEGNDFVRQNVICNCPFWGEKGERVVRKILSFFVLSVSIFIWSNTSVGQWQQANGPCAANVYALAVSDSNLYAGTAGGVFLSTDGGADWSSIAAGLPQYFYATKLLTNGTEIFAGGIGGVYVSTDEGKIWTAVDNGLTDTRITALNVLGQTLYAGTEGGNLFCSTNNGTSWDIVSQAMNGFSINTVLNKDSLLFAGTGGNGIFRSSDNGMHWVQVNSGLTGPIVEGGPLPFDYDVKSLVIIDTAIFAANYMGGVFLSTNNGTSWTQVDSGLTDHGIRTLVVSAHSLFLGTDGGVFLSTDNGASWKGMTSGISPTPEVTTLAVRGTSLFAGTWYRGVFRSTDNGASWTPANFNLPGGVVNTVFSNGNGLFAGTDVGIFFSADKGKTWSRVGSDSVNGYVFSLFEDGGEIFAGGANGTIYSSTDAGTNWVSTDLVSTHDDVKAIARCGASLLAGTFGSGTFLSTNNGASWQAANSGLNGTFDFYIRAFAVSDTTVFAATEGGVLSSTNCGTTWTTKNTGLPVNPYLNSPFVTSVAASGTYVIAGTDSCVFRSSDNGDTWASANSGLPSKAFFNSLLFYKGRLFAATDSGMFLSTDSASNWIEVNAGLRDHDIYSVSADDVDVFAGTQSSGLWLRPLSDMIDAVYETPRPVPSGFALMQNYPNPFNPSTTITYQIPSNARVILKVFDILGREVETLVDEKQTAGIHSVRLNATTLSSGVYLYRLEAGGFAQVRKLIVLK